MISFEILAKDKKSKARLGQIHTSHGIVETPTFTPVGTQATVKGLTPEDLKNCGAQLIFGNTYHLHLRPGEDLIADFGGLAQFMAWNKPTITDSGGFQVFSLGQKKIVVFDPGNHVGKVVEGLDHDNEDARLVNITQDGVKFRSHIDGSAHMFTPEQSITIQKKIGADLILAFDECAPYPSTHQYTKEAMERTHAWALRCLKASQGKQFYDFKQGLYGIVQGGTYEDLRIESAKFISSLAVDGIAIGGVSVGESKKETRQALKWVTPHLPENKPRHLLGIGEVDDIFDAVEYGMDTFDCVIPTRFGRYGIAFASPPEGNIKNRFRLDISKVAHARSAQPLDLLCECIVCKTYTRAYLHHLLRAQELLGYRLVSYHNVYFLLNLSKQIREAIKEERFSQLKSAWLT